MKTFIDYKLIQKIARKEDVPFEAILSWPSFLECLEVRSVFREFPPFDDQNKLFVLIKSILATSAEKDLLIRLYDQIFVECLTQVKALPQVNREFLLEQIEKKRDSVLFSDALAPYEKLLIENPYDLLHDLILYLAWDRTCVCIASLFDDPQAFQGLEVFKDCLVESFLHITMQKKSEPSLFRLLEALYAYYLREENLQMHSDEEWQVLCKASSLLAPREELVDVPYIDLKGKVLTLDSPERVKLGLDFARVIIEKLKKENLDWQYELGYTEVVFFKESNGDFSSMGR